MSDYTARAVAAWRERYPEIDLDAYAVVFRMVRLARLAEERLGEVAADFGLRVKGDYDTLALLGRSDGPVAPSHLAAQLLVTPAGMTSRIDRLEQRRLVERRADPTDRRSVAVEITAEGRTLLRKALERVLAIDAELLVGLDRSEWPRLAEELEALLVALGDV